MPNITTNHAITYTNICTGKIPPIGVPGILPISSDRDDRRIFLSEIFDSGIFLCWKIWQVCFFFFFFGGGGGWLDLSRDSFGYSKQPEDSW